MAAIWNIEHKLNKRIAAEHDAIEAVFGHVDTDDYTKTYSQVLSMLLDIHSAASRQLLTQKWVHIHISLITRIMKQLKEDYTKYNLMDGYPLVIYTGISNMIPLLTKYIEETPGYE